MVKKIIQSKLHSKKTTLPVNRSSINVSNYRQQPFIHTPKQSLTRPSRKKIQSASKNLSIKSTKRRLIALTEVYAAKRRMTYFCRWVKTGRLGALPALTLTKLSSSLKKITSSSLKELLMRGSVRQYTQQSPWVYISNKDGTSYRVSSQTYNRIRTRSWAVKVRNTSVVHFTDKLLNVKLLKLPELRLEIDKGVCYRPTLRLLWNFFSNYRLYVCSKLTRNWRLKEYERLRNWARANFCANKKSIRYYEFHVYRSFNLIRTGFSSEEKRVVSVQKHLRQLILQNCLDVNTELPFLARDHCRVVKTFLDIFSRKRSKKNRSRLLSSWEKLDNFVNTVRQKAIKKKSFKKLTPALRAEYRMRRLLSGVLWHFIDPQLEKTQTVIPTYTEYKRASEDEMKIFLHQKQWFCGIDWNIADTKWAKYYQNLTQSSSGYEGLKNKSVWNQNKARLPKPRPHWHQFGRQDLWGKFAMPAELGVTSNTLSTPARDIPKLIFCFTRAFSTLKGSKMSSFNLSGVLVRSSFKSVKSLSKKLISKKETAIISLPWFGPNKAKKKILYFNNYTQVNSVQRVLRAKIVQALLYFFKHRTPGLVLKRLKTSNFRDALVKKRNITSPNRKKYWKNAAHSNVINQLIYRRGLKKKPKIFFVVTDKIKNQVYSKRRLTRTKLATKVCLRFAEKSIDLNPKSLVAPLCIKRKYVMRVILFNKARNNRSRYQKKKTILNFKQKKAWRKLYNVELLRVYIAQQRTIMLTRYATKFKTASSLLQSSLRKSLRRIEQKPVSSKFKIENIQSGRKFTLNCFLERTNALMRSLKIQKQSAFGLIANNKRSYFLKLRGQRTSLKPRLFSFITLRSHRKRVNRRLRRDSAHQSGKTPTVWPTKKLSSRYDLQHYGSIFGSHKRNKLLKRQNTRQWTQSFNFSNRIILRKFAPLRLQALSPDFIQQQLLHSATKSLKNRLLVATRSFLVDKFPFLPPGSLERQREQKEKTSLENFLPARRHIGYTRAMLISCQNQKAGGCATKDLWLKNIVRSYSRLSLYSSWRAVCRLRILRTLYKRISGVSHSKNKFFGFESNRLLLQRKKNIFKVRKNYISLLQSDYIGRRQFGWKIKNATQETTKKSYKTRDDLQAFFAMYDKATQLKKASLQRGVLMRELLSVFKKVTSTWKLPKLPFITKNNSRLSSFKRCGVQNSTGILTNMNCAKHVNKSFQKKLKDGKMSNKQILLTSSGLWAYKRRLEIKALLASSTYYTPQYGIRARLKAKSSRILLSRKEQKDQKMVEYNRFTAVLSLYTSREARAEDWNEANSPFWRSVSIKKEERFKRNLHKERLGIVGDQKTLVLSGYPSALGYKRSRRIFRNKLTAGCLRKTPALSLPYQHPYALYPRDVRAPELGMKVLIKKGRRTFIPFTEQLALREHELSSYYDVSARVYNPTTDGKLPKLILPEVSSRKAYFTQGHTWKNNIGWRLLERQFGVSPAFKNGAVLHKWFPKKIANILSEMEQRQNNGVSVWTKYSKATSIKTSCQLRQYFIDSSYQWLNRLPIKCLTKNWTENNWLYFQRFIGGRLEETVGEFKDNFIRCALQEFFVREPNWWLKEAKLQSTNLLAELQYGQNPSAILKKLSVSSQERTLFSEQRELGWQEKKLVVFMSLQASTLEQQNLLLSSNNDSTDSGASQPDNNSTTYRNWLQGIQTHLKYMQKNQVRCGYNPLGNNKITELNTELPRFPGLARQRWSFDAFLRKQYSLTLPLSFRRKNSSRFKKICFFKTSNFMGQLIKYQSKISFSNGQRRGRNLMRVTFPSKQRRALYFKNKKNGVQKFGLVNKRRFASLPLEIICKTKKVNEQKLGSPSKAIYTGSGQALMQKALQKRFFDRPIRDLRKAARQRRLLSSPRKPFWIQNQLKIKKERSNQATLYNLPSVGGYVPAVTTQWEFSEFNLRVAKTGKYFSQAATAFGELIITPVKAVKRWVGARRIAALRQNVRQQKWKKELKLTTCFRTKISFLRRRRLKTKRLDKVKRRYLKRLRWSLLYFPSHWALPRKTLINTLRLFEVSEKQFTYRFVKQQHTDTVLTPLHFRRNTSYVSVSAMEKERWRLHVQATRQKRYRRLSEVSEALTTITPQIISRIIEDKIKIKGASPSQVTNLVNSIYWNLRVYLQQDFSTMRSRGRSNWVNQLEAVTKEISVSSADRFFGLKELSKERYRFQPHVLNPEPSLLRGSAEWLRDFLPKFYELYLEDPVKYKQLTLTPIKIFKAHHNNKTVSCRLARKVPGLMEHRYIRLTTERNAKNSPRFENMLMTTRRAPVIVGYGAAASLNVISPIGFSSARESFFSRSFFSTACALRIKHTGNSVVIQRMDLDNRQVTASTQPLPHKLASVIHYSSKNRAIRRAKMQQAVSSSETGAGSIDIRLLRAKSPRNSEYLQRSVSNIQLNSCAFKREEQQVHLRSKQQKLKKRRLYRSERSRFSIQSAALIKEKIKGSAQFIIHCRSRATTRRRSTFWQGYLGGGSQEISPSSRRRLFTYQSRLSLRNSWVQGLLVQSVVGYSLKQSLQGIRSILHFRRAEERTVFKYVTPKKVIISRSLQLKASVWNHLRLHLFRNKLLQRLPSRRDLLSPLVKKVGRFLIKDKKLWNAELTLNKLASTRFLLLAKRIFHKPQAVKSVWDKKLCFTSPKKSVKINLYNFFISHSKNIRYNAKIVSKRLNALEKCAALTLFSARRVELWNDLTLQRTKKLRVLKGWLKNVKYSLKEKTWIKAITHTLESEGDSYSEGSIVEETLFKATRLRLRKLDWRESDNKFSRHGLKTAFTFHPKERLNAPWLESLMYRRSLYSYRRGEYRRHQFPREQKSKKWLQRFRKLMYRRKASRIYIKRRRWPLLRLYNQRLHRSAFHIRNTKISLKRFRKLLRRKPVNTGFEKLMLGFGDRLDVNLMLLNIAPTTFWAREMASLGLLRVNGKTITEPTFRFTPGDYIEWGWHKIKKIQVHFRSPLKRYIADQALRNTSFYLPGNFAYCAGLRSARYLRLPRPEDLEESSRINSRMFRWFQLDSGLGKN